MNYAQPKASDSLPLELTEFACKIAHPSVINHKDKDVRLLGACAIADRGAQNMCTKPSL